MKKRIATIGFFDGVHLGHRFLFSQLRQKAQEHHLEPIIYTFLHHPKCCLTGTCPPLLTTDEERIRLLREVEQVEVLCFEEFHSMTAAEFMLYMRQQGVVELLMGYDHRFGSDQLTELTPYERIGEQVGIHILRATPYNALPMQVSSSAIRRAIEEGQIENANRMLGYTFRLSGNVVHGQALGRRLGFPTANIEVDFQRVLPLAGVYAGCVEVDNIEYKAVVNIGTNPTIGNQHVSIEVHLLGFSGDLYQRSLTIGIERFVRAEQRFASVQELSRQIALDVQSVSD